MFARASFPVPSCGRSSALCRNGNSALNEIEVKLRERLAALAPAVLEVVDESRLHAGHGGAQGGGRHFRLRIVSAAFDGKTMLERHRLIYDALGELMHRDVHALSIKALALGEI